MAFRWCVGTFARAAASPALIVTVTCWAAPAQPARGAAFDLTQKPGAEGCFSLSGDDGCAAGIGLDGAASVVVSPDGASVYVAGAESDAVAVFDRHADGVLSQKSGAAGCVSNSSVGVCAHASALDEPVSVAVSPDGANVYVTAAGSDAVVVFDRAADGGLTQKPGTAGCISEAGGGVCADGTALDRPASVKVSADGSNVYVAAAASNALVVFDRAPDGTLTQKPAMAGCISETGAGPCADGSGMFAAASLAVSPDGRNVYLGGRASYAVNVFARAADGSLTQIPGQTQCDADTGFCAPTSLTVSPDGENIYMTSFAYMLERQAGAIVGFDRASDGTLTQLPGPTGCLSASARPPCAFGSALFGAWDATVSPDGMSVYVAATGNGLALFDRAPDGSLTQRPPAAGCISPVFYCEPARGTLGAAQTAVSPDGTNVYLAAADSDAVAVFDRRLVPVVPARSDVLEPVQPAPQAPAVDRARPVLGRLSLSPTRFRVVTRLKRGGSRLSFSLSETASVRVTIQRAVRGRRSGKRCLRPRPQARRAARCTRYVRERGTLTYHATAGRNTMRLSGHIGHRTLKPNRYRLLATATDPAANASPRRQIHFTIIGPRSR